MLSFPGYGKAWNATVVIFLERMETNTRTRCTRRAFNENTNPTTSTRHESTREATKSVPIARFAAVLSTRFGDLHNAKILMKMPALLKDFPRKNSFIYFLFENIFSQLWSTSKSFVALMMTIFLIFFSSQLPSQTVENLSSHIFIIRIKVLDS